MRAASVFDLGALKTGETQALLLGSGGAARDAWRVGLGALRRRLGADARRGPAAQRGPSHQRRCGRAGGAGRELDPVVKTAVEKVMAYKLQARAWQDVQDGNLAQATARLRMVATRLLAAGEAGLARTAQTEADHLEQHGRPSMGGVKQIKYGTRGLGRTHGMPTEEAPR